MYLKESLLNVFCHNCGTDIKDGIFCPNCGAKVRDQSEKPAKSLDNSPEEESSPPASPTDRIEYTPNTSVEDNPVYQKPISEFERSNRFIAKPETKPEEKVEVDNALTYYLAALFWPIGLVIYFGLKDEKPVLADHMKDIMLFSGLLTLFLWWVGVFDGSIFRQ